uniref:Beta-1,4-galactosyltransferase n=1 Tax=Phallusia mammillata TaxID=59560 RepID=A0A6F9D6T0_9ASCI|nr:beta-1,4-galactosyltransferase 2 [Phallusia mammillata]
MVQIKIDSTSLEKIRESHSHLNLRSRRIALFVVVCIQVPILWTLLASQIDLQFNQRWVQMAKLSLNSQVTNLLRNGTVHVDGWLSHKNTTSSNNSSSIIHNSSFLFAVTPIISTLNISAPERPSTITTFVKLTTIAEKSKEEQDQATSKNFNLTIKHIGSTTGRNITGEILPDCPADPPHLQGSLEISFSNKPGTFDAIAADNPLGKDGGHFQPPFCKARSKVAIIIPFRNRDQHFQYFLHFMLPILQRQQLDFRIYIINQFGSGKFNRAKLMNIGFVEASKDYDFGCFVFHDVDLILENDKCLYTCPNNPRHLSVGVDKFNYRLPYSAIFGGVTELTREQFVKVNGYSNSFWGWGGEDDDMYSRIKTKGMNIMRYSSDISRYKMISHQRERGNEANPERFKMIQKTHQTMNQDGLNTLKYQVVSRDLHPTYTNITVNLFGPS